MIIEFKKQANITAYLKTKLKIYQNVKSMDITNDYAMLYYNGKDSVYVPSPKKLVISEVL